MAPPLGRVGWLSGGGRRHSRDRAVPTRHRAPGGRPRHEAVFKAHPEPASLRMASEPSRGPRGLCAVGEAASEPSHSPPVARGFANRAPEPVVFLLFPLTGNQWVPEADIRERASPTAHRMEDGDRHLRRKLPRQANHSIASRAAPKGTSRGPYRIRTSEKSSRKEVNLTSSRPMQMVSPRSHASLPCGLTGFGGFG